MEIDEYSHAIWRLSCYKLRNKPFLARSTSYPKRDRVCEILHISRRWENAAKSITVKYWGIFGALWMRVDAFLRFISDFMCYNFHNIFLFENENSNRKVEMERDKGEKREKRKIDQINVILILKLSLLRASAHNIPNGKVSDVFFHLTKQTLF